MRKLFHIFQLMKSPRRQFLPFRDFTEFFIAIVYFVQGAGGLASIASALILREELQLDFFQMGLIGAASVIPWSIKPLYGLLTDLFPIGGYRRKPYLHIGPLLAVLGYLTLGLNGNSFLSFLLPLVVANIGLGLTDVAIDGLIVEKSTSATAGRYQGISQGSIRVAAFVTSFLSGLLISRNILTPHQIYLVLGCLPLITFVASFFVQETKVSGPTEHKAHEILSRPFIASMLLIFVLLIGNLAFSEQAAALFHVPTMLLSTLVWVLFFGWIGTYFHKLIRQNLATRMIFLAAIFLLLWRFNPGAGSPLFFYMKDTLQLSEESLGFISTAGQVGSIIAVILAVKLFDKISLKMLLFWTTLVAALFGASAFGVTHVGVAETIGTSVTGKWLAAIVAVPVMLTNSLLALVSGNGFPNFWQAAAGLSPVERFLYLQTFIAEVLFMFAYIPLLKFAVLICPKKAEATNFAIITSIMNIGLALTDTASGALYEFLKNPALAKEIIDLAAINILIWINITTSLSCLLLLPFIKEKEAVNR